MEQHSKSYLQSGPLAFGLLIIGFISNILSSAKWGIGLFGWISPIGFLFFIRFSRIRWKWFLLFIVLITASVIDAKDVAPFPVPLLVILGLIESGKIILVYLTNEWVYKRSRQFSASFYLPAAFTCLEFINAKLGGGVWWSVANAQYGFGWLRQLASVTGIWGISFMIYWLAAVVVWSISEFSRGNQSLRGLRVYGLVFAMVMAYGAIRYHGDLMGETRSVKIAGITAPSFGFLTGLYADFSGKEVHINPRTSISSPDLQEINRAQVPFIGSADTIKFRRGYAAMQAINDSLFILSARAAAVGARIILWSEANALVFAFDEPALTLRASQFAESHKVYLLMSRAVILPGKIEQGRKFLKNEAILFGPDGRILNLFHKNNPVPFAEASVPGDGNIPVTETPYGRIATSICYDADFPIQMRQLGEKKAGLLLLPSGDWSAIAPYHSYMAIFRGIENGNAIFRQVSGGLSVATDYRGKMIGSFDFYGTGEKLWYAEVPIGHISTLYNRIGDLFAYLCLLVTMGWLAYLLIEYFTSMGRKTRTRIVSASA
ncbi:MAG: nitrilase-related carbon-nitrogen hydrolase [Chitinophagales bacterium]